VFFGHGENFSRGIDVDAFAPLAKTGQPFAIKDGMLDPFARTQQLSKPLIAVVHGDTWNMGHELHLVADIRVASADVRFGQDENTHGRFPGGGSTIRQAAPFNAVAAAAGVCLADDPVCGVTGLRGGCGQHARPGRPLEPRF
jgi:enoyl-CoA hydratase/carnithine racemase